jgi:hypothetical protein
METTASKRRQRAKHPQTEIAVLRKKQLQMHRGNRTLYAKIVKEHEPGMLPRLPPITVPQQKRYRPSRPERLPKNITYTSYPYTYR